MHFTKLQRRNGVAWSEFSRGMTLKPRRSPGSCCLKAAERWFIMTGFFKCGLPVSKKLKMHLQLQLQLGIFRWSYHGVITKDLLCPRRVARWSWASAHFAGNYGWGGRGRKRCSRRVAHSQGNGESSQGKPQQEKGPDAGESNCNERVYAALFSRIRKFVWYKSSQVNTLPKAKSQAKDKRAKDRQ
jgi:hypothetical protein